MNSKKKILLILFSVFLVLWLFCLPRDLFRNVPYSTVVLDSEGSLLGARIADDGQWRFPPGDSLPFKYAKAVVEFEDRTFYRHPGFSFKAIVRATVQNLASGHRVSGASTITMQVIRMSRCKERNIWQKAVEIFLATRLELRCSKDEILCMYASHAPFGSNVVGLEAACWRYLGCDPSQMSWAEAATLAVLPNSPSSIHVSKNRESLLLKRNRLLERLHQKGYLDDSQLESAMDEPLPQKPLPLPSYAFHTVQNYDCCRHGLKSVSDIKLGIQARLESIADYWCHIYQEQGIPDLAVVVIDVHTGKVVAYCGNAALDVNRAGLLVDVASSPRSTGSILKPVLYCAALQDDMIVPSSLLPDIPVNFEGFSPKNNDGSYSGAVSARDALCRSLNIPHVFLLKEYGVSRFCSLLREAGLTTLNHSSAHYGLSLILGGAETTLLDITSLYAKMAGAPSEDFPLTDESAIWHTLDAMSNLNRPDLFDRRQVSSIHKVAWKTGTSWGGRDAWSIGVTPSYAVGVWAGSAAGGSCPDISGARTAGTVMFDIFNFLPDDGKWFEKPLNDRFSDLPDDKSDSGEFSGIDRIFLLDNAPMRFIYPADGARITVPRQLDGSIAGITLDAVHRNSSEELFWNMDGDYLGSTKDLHKMQILPSTGPHTVTITDSRANRLSVSFEVL